MVSHPLLGAIAAYTQAVERGEVDCRLERCPNRNQRSAGFKYLAVRRRWLRVTVERMVKQVRSVFARWKGVGCQKIFTVYPAFTLPT